GQDAGKGSSADFETVSGEAAQIDQSLRHAKVESDRERSYVPCNGRGDGTPAFLFQDAELAVAGRRFGLVADPLADVQGALVPVGGLLVVPADLGEQAEMVVAGGHAGLVAEPLADVQGALAPHGALLVVPAGLDKDAELAVGGGHSSLV